MSKRLSSGHEVVAMSEEWLARLEQDQILYNRGMIRLMPDGWLYPTAFTDFADRYYNFKFRESDVVVMTMLKSGTTWMQEIVWTMLHNPDLNHPQANKSIFFRSPEIDMDMVFDSKALNDSEPTDDFLKAFDEICPGRKLEDGMNLQMSELIHDPRIIKTHLPLCLFSPELLDKAKVVYVARNPKDVVVSCYRFLQLLKANSYRGSFESFVKQFMEDEVFFTPYWKHVQLAWEKRNHPNLHFVFYEDLKADNMTELRKISDFIGADLTQEQLDNVARHTTFEAMKSRGEPFNYAFVNTHLLNNNEGLMYRKGTMGDWKNHFSPELEKQMNRWMEAKCADLGITFK